MIFRMLRYLLAGLITVERTAKSGHSFTVINGNTISVFTLGALVMSGTGWDLSLEVHLETAWRLAY